MSHVVFLKGFTDFGVHERQREELKKSMYRSFVSLIEKMQQMHYHTIISPSLSCIWGIIQNSTRPHTIRKVVGKKESTTLKKIAYMKISAHQHNLN